MNGQENDFRMLLERNSIRLLGIARVHATVGDREDLFQEMLMQTWRSLGIHQDDRVWTHGPIKLP